MDLIRLSQFPSVPADGVATLVTNQLQDYAVHGLVLERGGGAFTPAMLTNLRLRLNGKDVLNGLTAPRLIDLNEYDGLTTVTNYDFIYFGDPTARTIRGQHLGDIDLSFYRTPLELECTIAGATTPTLRAYALAEVPKRSMGLGFTDGEAAAFRALIRTVTTPAAAVTRQSTQVSLGSGAGALIRKLGLFHTNLTAVDFAKQSLRKWDDIPTALNSAVAQQFARVPQSGLYVLDRVVDGNIGGAEPTVQADGRPWNLELSLTTSGADTITTFADVLTNFAIL
jgi:hypothetical protein